MARLRLKVEEVVLEKNDEAMAQLSGREGSEVKELGDGGSTLVHEGCEDALQAMRWISTRHSHRARAWESMRTEGTYGREFAIDVIYEQSAELCQVLGL